MKRIPIELTEKDWLRICALLMVHASGIDDGEGIFLSSKIMAQLGSSED